MSQFPGNVMSVGKGVTVNYYVNDADSKRTRSMRRLMELKSNFESFLIGKEVDALGSGAREALLYIHDLFADIIEMVERDV